MIEITEQSPSVSSVTLSRNAKGGVQPEVKVYDPDPAKAKDLAVKLFDELAAKYPAQS